MPVQNVRPVAASEIHDTTRPVIDFNRDIVPILATHCFECHGPDTHMREAGLRLDTRQGAFAELESGGFAIIPGDITRSKLVERITSADDDLRMPPLDAKRALTEDQVQLLSGWVTQGATWKQHWAFIAPKTPVLPVVKNQAWIQNDIDLFILARLEMAGLEPAPAADRRTLVRRAFFDLIGLPPTVDQVNRFLNSPAPNAYTQLIDRLLASPHYGPRWGRHWLDVARYGDSNGGDENHLYPHAYHYRNYVIDAFNHSLPYDQFVREQLAADLLPPGDHKRTEDERVAATGFLALGTKIIAEKDLVKKRADIVDEQIDTFGRAMLGITLGCARCHDHKFDPVPTSDYYALAGIFHSTRLEDRPRQDNPDDTIMAVADGAVSNAKIHIRGDHLTLGEEVPRQFLQVMADQPVEPIPVDQSGRMQLTHWLTRPDSASGGLTSRVMVNRIWHWHFGRGIVGTPDNLGIRGDRPTHPLLLDYLALRFIRDEWSIKSMHRLMILSSTYRMSTQNDNSEALRIDPENRLFWCNQRRRLEAEIIRDTLLMHVDRLDPSLGGAPPEVKSLDPSPEDLVNNRQFYEHSRRRSVYLPVVRTNVYKFLTILDFPNAATPVGRRARTIVPTQALMMMNNPFVITQADSLAKKILGDRHFVDDTERLMRLYEQLFSRPPSADELAGAAHFIETYERSLEDESHGADRRWKAWSALCQTWFASNEFFYVN